MPSTKSLLSRLKADYPQFSFRTSDRFRWSADEQTVFIDQDAPYSDAFILHELSHAILGHHDYRRDIDLIKLERDAWEHAVHTLAKRYDVVISDDITQDNLDTYRDWLHARSTCPQCQATGLQTLQRQYKCVACGHNWQVNEARICALRRYKAPQTQKHTR